MVKGSLDSLFSPRSVAVVGVSTKGIGLQVGGVNFLHALLHYGFKGNIYPVNPRGGEVLGLKVYPSIKDITTPVDYVISAIPLSQILQLIEDCITKKVKAIHIYTGGFSESGSEEGKRLEESISFLAHRNGIRILGPNCAGVYCPKAGLSFSSDFPTEAGSTSLYAQSGGNSVFLTREATQRGVRFSKVVSYGNACDVNESDLLEHLATDVDTKVIAIYIEGVKDGRRFSRLLRKTAKEKPVIVLKGGVSEAGARAASSHTGALASSVEVWDGLLRQASVIRVDTLEELSDMMVTFDQLSLPAGRRVAILGIGGGATVLATDCCTRAGLVVPCFPQEIQDTLRNHVQMRGLGTVLSNPVDLSDQGWDVTYGCAKVILDYDDVDLLIFQLSIDQFPSPFHGRDSVFNSLIENIIKVRRETHKPVAVVIHSATSPDGYHLAFDLKQKCTEAWLPVYHSLSNAAKAIARFLDYHEHKARMLKQD